MVQIKFTDDEWNRERERDKGACLRGECIINYIWFGHGAMPLGTPDIPIDPNVLVKHSPISYEWEKLQSTSTRLGSGPSSDITVRIRLIAWSFTDDAAAAKQAWIDFSRRLNEYATQQGLLFANTEVFWFDSLLKSEEGRKFVADMNATGRDFMKDLLELLARSKRGHRPTSIITGKEVLSLLVRAIIGGITSDTTVLPGLPSDVNFATMHRPGSTNFLPQDVSMKIKLGLKNLYSKDRAVGPTQNSKQGGVSYRALSDDRRSEIGRRILNSSMIKYIDLINAWYSWTALIKPNEVKRTQAGYPLKVSEGTQRVIVSGNYPALSRSPPADSSYKRFNTYVRLIGKGLYERINLDLVDVFFNYTPPAHVRDRVATQAIYTAIEIYLDGMNTGGTGPNMGELEWEYNLFRGSTTLSAGIAEITYGLPISAEPRHLTNIPSTQPDTPEWQKIKRVCNAHYLLTEPTFSERCRLWAPEGFAAFDIGLSKIWSGGWRSSPEQPVTPVGAAPGPFPLPGPTT